MQGTSVTGFVLLLLFLDQYFIINEEVLQELELPSGTFLNVLSVYNARCRLLVCLHFLIGRVFCMTHTHTQTSLSQRNKQNKNRNKAKQRERQSKIITDSNSNTHARTRPQATNKRNKNSKQRREEGRYKNMKAGKANRERKSGGWGVRGVPCLIA